MCNRLRYACSPWRYQIAKYIQAKQVPDGVTVQVKADVGFINERPPHHFAGKVLYVCILVETSDGRKIHFARTRYVKYGPFYDSFSDIM